MDRELRRNTLKTLVAILGAALTLAPSPDALATKLHSKAAREVLARYGFPADMGVSEDEAAPRGWVDARKEPARALRVGTPTRVPSTPLGLHAGVFLPSQLALLRGGHELVGVHNAALSLWRSGDVATAAALLDGANDTSKRLPRASLERRNFELLRGHLHLMRHVAFTLVEGQDGENAKEARGKALGAYGDAFENQDPGSLFAVDDVTIDGRVLRSFLSRGFFRERGALAEGARLTVGTQVEPGSTLPITLADIPVDPIANLRSQALPVLWNLAIMKAQNGNWQAAFEIAAALEHAFAKLGPRAPLFEGPEGTPLLRLYDVDTAANALWFLPRRRADMAATLSLVRAAALRQADDPVEVLRYADQAIRAADDPLISAAGFHLVASVYGQLGNGPFLRRALDWAAAMGARYEGFAPALLFTSAEDHFWAGRRAAARRSYEAFLASVGDKRIGPWAHLRLALLDHVEGDEEAALVRYAKLRRLFPSHPASTEALVRLFCSTPVEGPRARRALLEEVMEATATSAPAILEQAKACALDAKLTFTREETAGARSRESVVQRSRKLLSQLEEFRKEFPASPFLALHAEEERRLSLSEGQTLLAGDDCKALVRYFREKGGKGGATLFDPALGPARWGDEERHRVFRCAAVERAFDLWRLGVDGRWEPSTRSVQEALLAHEKAPTRDTERTLLDRFRALWPKADPLAVARAADASGDALLRSPDFWKAHVARRLMAAALAMKGGPKASAWGRSLAAKAATNPGAVHADPATCLAAVEGFDSASRARKDALLDTLEGVKWLALLEGPVDGARSAPAGAPAASAADDARGEGADLERCRRVLAGKLLTWSQEDGAGARARNRLLLPWLERRGVRGAPDEWLRYAQDLARSGGPRDARAREAFKRIAREADEGVAREGARVWLESTSASGDDGP